MLSAEANKSHYSTLKSWTDSSEFNRSELLKLLAGQLHGSYSVRMQGSLDWIPCDLPPLNGADEWLFSDKNGIPILYWSKQRKAVMLIG
ncbi:MAG: hypothetical protein K2X27_15025 [Candidatus Obscuribacterales bacterium]|nr:hypothetical protein [Candidatus Obscuribacterales bacterium]